MLHFNFSASKKEAFHLYFATPLLSRKLPSDHLFFLMLLTVHIYVKVQEKCSKATFSEQKCCCGLASQYFVIVEVLERHDKQLPKYREKTVVNHITRIKTSNRYTVVIWSTISRPVFFSLMSFGWQLSRGKSQVSQPSKSVNIRMGEQVVLLILQTHWLMY